VISSDGRSRGFINGTAVPLSQLRELGQLLIQIHGQHAHQQLVKPEQQKPCSMAMRVSMHLLN
jgi:DNA repair protein RecN (Recombination protein N)